MVTENEFLSDMFNLSCWAGEEVYEVGSSALGEISLESEMQEL
jgi:hypothetical protein